MKNLNLALAPEYAAAIHETRKFIFYRRCEYQMSEESVDSPDDRLTNLVTPLYCRLAQSSLKIGCSISFYFKKNSMNTRKIANPVLALLLFGFAAILPVATVHAQEEPAQQPSVEMREDFSDNELKSFVKANEKVTVIQMEAEQKMIKSIEDEGLTVERFNEILEQQRDPSRATETSVEELQSFNNAAQIILEENARIEKEMTTSIEGEGIDIETYKQIMVAYQQSPDVQTRVNSLVNGDN